MAEMPTYRPPDLSLVGDDHVRRYRETDGAEGYLWNGAPIVLLTTIGRRSGVPRTSALIHGRRGDDYLVVASKGGAPEHPLWYRNLVEHPRVRLQDRDRVFDADARTATEAERPELWAIMRAVWPNYDTYETRTTRRIPVVVLHPVEKES